jgi:DNA-binding transcriptional LysR family regulator
MDMPTPNLNAIRAFVEVAETGGFRRAASTLGMSPTSVSQHVSKLEEELGVKLFERTTRRVALTGTGRAYFERCQRLFAELEEISNGARSSFREPLGLLRISATNTIGRKLILPHLLAFMKKYPPLQVDLLLTGRYVDLETENIDLAIRGRIRKGDVAAYRELPPIPMLLCASPEYLRNNGTPHSPPDLEHHQCIVQTHRPHDQVWQLLDGAGTEHSVHVGGRLTVNDTSALIQVALNGFGIISIADFLVEDYLVEGLLVQVLPNYRPPSFKLFAAYRPNDQTELKVRSCLDYLADGLLERLGE